MPMQVQRRANPVGRRRGDWLRDRAIWLLVLGALFQGGAAGLLVLQMRWEDENRRAERAMWERQLEQMAAHQAKLLEQMAAVTSVLQSQAGDQAQPAPRPPPKLAPVKRAR
jgi:hypothetical protein